MASFCMDWALVSLAVRFDGSGNPFPWTSHSHLLLVHHRFVHHRSDLVFDLAHFERVIFALLSLGPVPSVTPPPADGALAGLLWADAERESSFAPEFCSVSCAPLPAADGVWDPSPGGHASSGFSALQFWSVVCPPLPAADDVWDPLPGAQAFIEVPGAAALVRRLRVTTLDTDHATNQYGQSQTKHEIADAGPTRPGLRHSSNVKQRATHFLAF